MITKKQFIKEFAKTSYEILQEQNPTKADKKIAKNMAITYWEENEDEIKYNDKMKNKKRKCDGCNVTEYKENKRNIILCFDCRKKGIPCYCNLDKTLKNSLKKINQEIKNNV